MTAASTFEQQSQTSASSIEPLKTREPGRRTDPLLPVPVLPPTPASSRNRLSKAARGGKKRASLAAATSCSVSVRLRAQLPAFAPLLEELEIAGWSSHQRPHRGNFHDWLLLGSDRVLVVVGHAADPESLDPAEPAFMAQAAWTAIRAHAVHTRDAGELLSLAARTLWSTPAAAIRAAVAIALVDTAGGRASIALAGDCLAWRVRAATSEQVAVRQPALGAAADFSYLSHSFELSLRERLILAADDTLQRPSRLASGIASGFSHLDAETHRRMTAADAVALVRQHYERVTPGPQACTSASVAAIRRR